MLLGRNKRRIKLGFDLPSDAYLNTYQVKKDNRQFRHSNESETLFEEAWRYFYAGLDSCNTCQAIEHYCLDAVKTNWIVA